jgi:hypothetical protein
MIEIATSAVQRFLKTPDAAIHLGLSARTLEKHRCYGTGPVYRKLVGRIVYAIADLNAWARNRPPKFDVRSRQGVCLPARPVRR